MGDSHTEEPGRGTRAGQTCVLAGAQAARFQRTVREKRGGLLPGNLSSIPGEGGGERGRGPGREGEETRLEGRGVTHQGRELVDQLGTGLEALQSGGA